MSAVEQCLRLTKAIYSVLLNGKKESREEWINQVNALFDEREELFPQISEPFSPEEREMGNQIISLNSRIQELLATNHLHLQDEMSSLRSKKTNMKKYINPYDQVNRDGTFYDKRN
ncbi:flagellar protein FliT [Jeotgalibacillus campisalis]|uniref:Flagellar protein FliT n=1 Tax=Jeotgalibacillus campisalis TaxID=220754 RepID=A0A0C2V1M4_9BACL|nr:flagellar protein FliT [Jeotgalibacillus campisalis]KIL42967.1 hypothetical protein KR50_33700 [Jeotgalibacillus campisalis]